MIFIIRQRYIHTEKLSGISYCSVQAESVKEAAMKILNDCSDYSSVCPESEVIEFKFPLRGYVLFIHGNNEIEVITSPIVHQPRNKSIPWYEEDEDK
jgi:hypothetical protein